MRCSWSLGLFRCCVGEVQGVLAKTNPQSQRLKKTRRPVGNIKPTETFGTRVLKIWDKSQIQRLALKFKAWT